MLGRLWTSRTTTSTWATSRGPGHFVWQRSNRGSCFRDTSSIFEKKKTSYIGRAIYLCEVPPIRSLPTFFSFLRRNPPPPPSCFKKQSRMDKPQEGTARLNVWAVAILWTKSVEKLSFKPIYVFPLLSSTVRTCRTHRSVCAATSRFCAYISRGQIYHESGANVNRPIGGLSHILEMFSRLEMHWIDGSSWTVDTYTRRIIRKTVTHSPEIFKSWERVLYGRCSWYAM